jgi:D-lactate dehydrogenase
MGNNILKVVVFSARTYDEAYFKQYEGNGFHFEYIEEALSDATVHLAAGAFAISIFVNDDASESVLEKLAVLGLKGIAIRAAGHDQTDKKAAHRLGIHVANVPAYSPHSIAEHTVALMLSLSRHIVEADRRVKAYNFNLDPLVGFNLHHKKVGIIGVGKIGSLTAKILTGFGSQLLAYDPKPSDEYAALYNIAYTSLDILIRTSDIIVIHAPLTTETKKLINSHTIALMKEGVMIINTGRGGIIETLDAIEGLKSGKIGALGIDVYEYEKGLFFNDHSNAIPKDDVFARLLTFKNVLVTGHMAFLTTNALTSIAQTTIENISAWEKGVDSINEL